MPKQILVVCVGNICRSPMAEALLGSLLDPAYGVSSAGIGALVGDPAHPMAVQLMQEQGLDISTHRGRQLDESLLQAADIVLPMEQQHARWIEERWPHARGRVFRFGHWDDTDIPDPYKRDEQVFRDVLELITTAAASWKQQLDRL
ncbi:MAG: low molecular weight phosphotyrosine protein phosphatase [Gammaproteobacteria bacterium]|nr:low molecular weight phosphotyrosine protein phosphatase [Gammaproteobacteria bacterium]